MNRIHKVVLSGAIAVIVGGGIVAASAVALGGINSTGVGSEDSAVGSCDTNGVSVSYTYAYNPAAGHQHYDIATAIVGGIASPACDGKDISVTLTGANGVELDTSTPALVPAGVSGNAAATVSFSGSPSAEDLQGVSIIISG